MERNIGESFIKAFHSTPSIDELLDTFEQAAREDERNIHGDAYSPELEEARNVARAAVTERFNDMKESIEIALGVMRALSGKGR